MMPMLFMMMMSMTIIIMLVTTMSKFLETQSKPVAHAAL